MAVKKLEVDCLLAFSDRLNGAAMEASEVPRDLMKTCRETSILPDYV